MAKRFPLGDEWLARFRFVRVSPAPTDRAPGVQPSTAKLGASL